MGVAVDNLVYEFSTTTGSGNFTLAAMITDTPSQAFRNFSDAFGTGTAALFYYAIRNRTVAEFEVGIGYMSTTTVMVRQTVLQSSNSNSAVNFSAGIKDVISDIPALFQYQIACTAKTVNYSIATTDNTIELTANSATFTLPDATLCPAGKEFFLKNSGTGTLSWNTTSSQTADGATSGTVGQGGGQYSATTFICNGTKYLIKA